MGAFGYMKEIDPLSLPSGAVRDFVFYLSEIAKSWGRKTLFFTKEDLLREVAVFYLARNLSPHEAKTIEAWVNRLPWSSDWNEKSGEIGLLFK